MTTTPPGPLRSGIDFSARDPEVRQQDDIYGAWLGRWLAEFEIPADKAEYAAFTALHDTAQEQLRSIIDDLTAQQPPPHESAGKVAVLYADFMATDRLAELGLAPLEPVLAAIDSVETADDLGPLLGRLIRWDVTTPLGVVVHQDNRDSTRYVLDIRQSGLGLPDRDFYLDDKYADLLTAYREHVARMWGLAGWAGDPKSVAESIVALESRIAQVHWDKVRNRDPQATYNLRTVAELESAAPGLRPDLFLASLGIAPSTGEPPITVGQPDTLNAVSALLSEVDLGTWRDYLRWHALSGLAPYLPATFDDADFAFYGTVLRGIPEQRPRWKRGVELVHSALGEALGQVYVQRHFPAANKARMQELVTNLLGAFEESLGTLDWMTDETRQRAQEKLGTFRAKIGYPDVWRDYSALAVRPGSLVGNVLAAQEFEADRNLGKLGGPIDHEEWFMPPQMVNAYYNPEMNEIVFPAAILQPPFFTMTADDAVNYGAIGAVIGHEISHGFDDQGSQYDGDGNLRDWWTDADRAAFARRTEALVAQYEKFEPIEGHHLNGRLTLGENIADLSGLAVALRAYRRTLRGAEAPVIDGLTGEQRFFLGWVQVWRAKTREEEQIRRIAIDPHSPPRYRVLGALTNSAEFHEAFDVTPQDGMYRPAEQRVTIW